MIIIIDNREQTPVLIDKLKSKDFPGLKFKFGTLKTGDYSIEGFDTPSCEHSITVERKSFPDLLMSTGTDRERLEKEFIRLSEFDHAELVVERDIRHLFDHAGDLSGMHPNSVYGTMIAWSQRYGVHFWPCHDREFMERHIFRTLKRFYDDRKRGGKMEYSKI